MAENKNDQHPQQPADNSGHQSTQNYLDSDLDEINIKVQEIEEWDVVVTDQKKTAIPIQ
ncbi:MAG: hypothetical protein M3004_10070 [Bacteroidota bacterium]|nr:hypothetical protein [Bacteroidota bacterium]